MAHRIDDIHTLPCNLKICSSHIRKIDVAITKMSNKIESWVHQQNDSSPATREKLQIQIETSISLILELAREKISLSSLAYNMVDNTVQFLDNEFNRLGVVIRHGYASSEEREKIMNLYNITNRQDTVVSNTQMNAGIYISPNELLYCVCDRPSFGAMVACDNVDCIKEWFHLACVGLRKVPDGKWYCPSCRQINSSNTI